MSSEQRERILVLAHGHPDFSLGGGEIAAYNLFQAYRRHADVEDAWFLARADRGQGATGVLGKRRDHEYLWQQGTAGWAARSAHRESVHTWFADLLRALRPTVLHAHHYIHLGLDILQVAKQVDPDMKVYLTLHEYIAICANNGQMIKTDGRLCSRESLDDCRMCFPDRSIEDFWLRKHHFQRNFDLVDGFVSPSTFLKGRYTQWGLDAHRIAVIENGQADRPTLSPRPLAEGATRNRFGYFGQINPYKGLDTVLTALTSMTAEQRSRLVVEVHGANFERQGGDYRERIDALRVPLMEEGVLRWAGPYQPHEIADRMAGVDWVMVPSVWWENSPMVIQEALTYGRPLVVSNIGGMAEKVEHEVTGEHVPVANHLAWAEALLRLSGYDQQWTRYRDQIAKPLSYDECAQQHLDIYMHWRA